MRGMFLTKEVSFIYIYEDHKKKGIFLTEKGPIIHTRIIWYLKTFFYIEVYIYHIEVVHLINGIFFYQRRTYMYKDH